MTGIYFLMVLEFEIPDQGLADLVSGEDSSQLANGCLLAVSSHDLFSIPAWRERDLKCVFPFL